MFSALKRLTGNKVENGITSAPPGHQAMSQNLQRRFARGVHYNMKIIIKGDRNTGKTCLFHRLKGEKFLQEYTPTEEIQVASIQWSYKTTEDVVKVEVWDVVDIGKKRAVIGGLKLDGDGPPPALDAEFLDVYKGTNGVILVMDITKTWTFDYIQKEVAKIPEHIPVLILGNHCDMAHHRTVSRDVVLYWIESVQRGGGGAQVRYTEASMSNGFGLKYIHKFFGLPFLQLQRETLLGQLERNASEAALTLQELDLFQQGPDSDYDKFLERLSKRRREAAESSSSAASEARSPLPAGGGVCLPQAQSLANTTYKPAEQAPQSRPDRAQSKGGGGSGNQAISVEEFVPDGGILDKSFLEDSPQVTISSSVNNQDSDSDGDAGGNPLVAGFQDDLDPDDVPSSTAPASAPKSGDEDWTSGLAGRESPEGQDSCITDPVDVSASRKTEKTSKHKQKHKKKTSKEKEDVVKEEKKKKKKSIKRNSTDGVQNELEEFLNSHDTSYEAL